jgi:branched-chain amino acid transport system substrate-binding protein
MKKVTLALVIVVLAGGALAQTARIGVNLELSGRFATIGTSTLQGIETALAQMPDSDRFELSICDNATLVENSVACANRFVDEGVIAVLGPISTSMAIPAAEVLQAAGIIKLSTSSTNPATTQIGDYVFRMAYTDDFQGTVAARYAFDDLGAREAIVFRQQDDDYSFGLAGFFAEEFENLGGSTIVVDFVANTVDFSAQISDVLGLPADVIYYSGFCAEGAALMPSLRAAGFTQQILGADASDDSQCPEGGGAAFDGYVFTGFGGPEVLTGEAAERAGEFESFFRVQNPGATDFNGFTLAGADSMNVIAHAVRQADSVVAADVRAALQAVENYAGVSGDITFAGTDGTPADRTIGFFQYQVPAPDGSTWTSVPLFGIGTGD